MQEEPILNAKGEEAWMRLKQHVEWCEHFALGFVFADDESVVNIFRERLAKIYRARVTHLIIPVPKRPEDLTDELLPRLLNPPLHQQALKAPFWIDLSRRTGPHWHKARIAFLIRLNEQREPLRHVLDRPLIFVLPAGERTLIRKLVPDLWAIRDFSLTTESWAKTGFALTPSSAQTDAMPARSTGRDLSYIEEWDRLQNKKSVDRGIILAAQRAIYACLRMGRHEQATGIAIRQESVARKRLSDLGETPEALRDLSVSLNNVGKTANASGQFETAEKAFREGDAIAAFLSKALPDHLDYRNLHDHFQERLKALKHEQ